MADPTKFRCPMRTIAPWLFAWAQRQPAFMAAHGKDAAAKPVVEQPPTERRDPPSDR